MIKTPSTMGFLSESLHLLKSFVKDIRDSSIGAFRQVGRSGRETFIDLVMAFVLRRGAEVGEIASNSLKNVGEAFLNSCSGIIDNFVWIESYLRVRIPKLPSEVFKPDDILSVMTLMFLSILYTHGLILYNAVVRTNVLERFEKIEERVLITLLAAAAIGLASSLLGVSLSMSALYVFLGVVSFEHIAMVVVYWLDHPHEVLKRSLTVNVTRCYLIGQVFVIVTILLFKTLGYGSFILREGVHDVGQQN